MTLASPDDRYHSREDRRNDSFLRGYDEAFALRGLKFKSLRELHTIASAESVSLQQIEV
jgi:hypothetical protein